jgi:hypothetical protein
MTLRKKGTEVGTLKTRIGFLIRDQAASWHGAILGAIFNSIPLVMRGLDPRIHLGKCLFGSGMDCRVKPGNDGRNAYATLSRKASSAA